MLTGKLRAFTPLPTPHSETTLRKAKCTLGLSQSTPKIRYERMEGRKGRGQVRGRKESQEESYRSMGWAL
jgi:hypothetical protein